MNPSFAILGTGALGGYYGARLHHAGFETHFLLHRDYATVQKCGLRVDSIYGDFSIAKPLAWPDLESIPPCDVLCISMKSTANAVLKNTLATKIKPGGCILVLQNGIGIEEEIAQWVPGIPVIGGLCFLCSNKVAPGHIKHLDYGAIRLGALEPHTPEASQWLPRLQECLQLSGIETSIAASLGVARWQKLVWNIPFNGLCVVLQCTTLELMNSPAGFQLAQALMHEVAAAASACGTPIPQSFVQKMLDDTLRMAPYLPSMRLDYDRAQPMEIDAIYTRAIQRAQSYGFSMNLAKMLREQLIFLEECRKQGDLPCVSSQCSPEPPSP